MRDSESERTRRIELQLRLTAKLLGGTISTETTMLWLRALKPHSIEEIEWAFEMWIANGKPFYPKPCEIIAWCRTYETSHPRCFMCHKIVREGEDVCSMECQRARMQVMAKLEAKRAI